MAKRSLKATTEGIALAKRAFERTGWTQDYLAAEVGLSTRQSVWKFFSGRPIERHYFIEICFQLNLDWHDIADIPPPLDASPALADAVGTGQGALPASAIAPVSSVSSPGTVPGQGLAVEGSHVDGDPNRRDRDIHGPGNVDVDVLLDRVRPQWRDRLMAQLGSYQASLDLAQPLDLRTAYTPLHISWDLSHQRWLEVSDLESSSPTPRGFAPQGDRSSASYPSAQQDLANRDRTVLLGKPGSGKTTLLRHLALACAAGDFRPGLFPVFVSLRHWSTATVTGMADAMPPLLPPLQEHIAELWNLAGMGAAETEAVLEAGRGLILLDGLDEVPTSDFGPMVQAIQQFAYHYYQTPIILTCRTAADRIRLQGFAYGELRDLDWAQVKTFAQRWFTAIAPLPNPPEEGGSHPRAQEFLDHLELPSNQAIRHLVKTPILLSLVCSVFHARATFPTQRSKLYKAGLDILLGHWDSARGIRRESPYQQLSTVEKLRLLAQLAAAQFEIGRTFFEKSDVLASISDFLTVRAASTAQGPQTPSDRGEFWEHQWAEAETILTDIVVQHGLLVECARDIYAFSHLTFQEYLTARKWVAALAANAAQEGVVDARD
ncbi:MAG: NACHT domain-containing protein, partial [Cyanobacteria bacterium P01_H01_bin.130]